MLAPVEWMLHQLTKGDDGKWVPAGGKSYSSKEHAEEVGQKFVAEAPDRHRYTVTLAK